MDRLANKVAVMTGGSSGIGRASAIAFSHEGADVVVVDMDDRGAAETVDIITRSGGSVGRARKQDQGNMEK